MATSGKVGAVYAPVTNIDGDILKESTTDTFSGDGTQTTFELSNEYIYPKSQVVTVDGSQPVSNKYTLDYINGTIEFSEPPTDDVDNVSVEYDYLGDDNGDVLEQAAGFFEWEFDEEANLEESPEFGDEVVTHTSTIPQWSGSADKYWSVDDKFQDWLGELVVVAFYIDTTDGAKRRFEGWGTVGDKSVECPVDTLVEEGISFESESKLEYRQA